VINDEIGISFEQVRCSISVSQEFCNFAVLTNKQKIFLIFLGRTKIASAFRKLGEKRADSSNKQSRPARTPSQFPKSCIPQSREQERAERTFAKAELYFANCKR
jgi:hypothetical protein